MKLSYFKDTDTLYIELTPKTSYESEEVSPGIVLDFDDQNKVVGIEIEGVSKNTDLNFIESDSVSIQKN